MDCIHIRKGILLGLLFLTNFLPLYSQETCCQKDDCRNEAQALSFDLSMVLKPLGADPNDFQSREAVIDTFRLKHRDDYQKITQIIKKIDQFNQTNLQGLSCVNNFIEDEDVLDWSTHFFLKLEQVKSLSPEFCKGLGIHFDLNTGVANLFKDSESFSSSSRLLLSYTISRKGCGGRFRVMLGPSIYYQDRKTFYLLNPRVELRLKDIGTDLLSIGNIKLIGQANFNKNILITGLGLGLEFDRLGAQVLGEYQTGVQQYSIQTGLFYRFKL